MQRAQPLEVFGQFGAVCGLAARERVPRQVVGVAQMVDAGQLAPNILRLPAIPPTEVPPKFTP